MGWRDAERADEDDLVGRMTLPRAFEASADRHADGVAQRYKGGVHDRSLAPGIVPAAPDGAYASLSYREMRDVVRRLAAGFRDLGIEPGDRVGILADTRMEWAQVDLALLAAGAVVTTVYTDSLPERVRYLLDDAGASGVVVGNDAHLDRVLDVEGDLDLDVLVSMNRVPGEHRGREDVHGLGEVHERGADAFDPEAYEGWLDARDPGDLASLVYTSGTTGRPKGVRLTHWNFKANVDQCRRRFGPRPDVRDPAVDADARAVSFLPLAHVFERLVGHFLLFASGASVAYAGSPDTLREDFAAVRPTIGTGVPRVYERIIRAAREQAATSPVSERVFEWATDVGRTYATADDPGPALRAKRRVADALVFSTVREALGDEIDVLISGGASLPPELCALYHGMGLPVLEGYGLTETAPVISVNSPSAPEIGTIGPPLVGVELRLDGDAAPDDLDDAGGTVGELLVRGPNVTDGYWNAPEETAAAFDDGWFRTGDIVERGPDGYLRFRERIADLLVLSTGKNVAPGRIEDAFAEREYVEQCMVVGDGRPFVTALIVPDLAAVRRWAAGAGIDLPDDDGALCRDDRVRDLIGDEVEGVNRRLEPHETIERFRLLPEAFTVGNGLLTPTLKKKRRRILDRHADAVEALYRD